MPPVPPPPPLARPARSRTRGRSSAACCCAGTSSSMRRQRSSSRPPSRPRSRPVSPPGRAGDRGFPASAASRCPDNGSCPDPWNSSITPRTWRPRGRRGGAGWPTGEVLRMNLACRYVQAGVSTAFSTAFSAAAYGLHRPARCGMHVLEPGRLAAGFSPRSPLRRIGAARKGAARVPVGSAIAGLPGRRGSAGQPGHRERTACRPAEASVTWRHPRKAA